MVKTVKRSRHSGTEIQEQIALLGDPAIEKRHEAVSALREIGEPAVPSLIAALAEAADNDQRWYTAIALSRIGEPAVISLVMAMERNPARDFRKYAAAALGEIGGPAIDALIDGMASDDRELRGFFSQALCRIGKPAHHMHTGDLGCAGISQGGDYRSTELIRSPRQRRKAAFTCLPVSRRQVEQRLRQVVRT